MGSKEFFDALLVHIERGTFLFLRNDVDDTFGFFAVHGFHTSRFSLSCNLSTPRRTPQDRPHTPPYRVLILGTSRPKILVRIPDFFIRQSGLFTEHVVDDFMEVEDVSGKGFSRDHVTHLQRMRT